LSSLAFQKTVIPTTMVTFLTATLAKFKLAPC
jgi:hypothetical protein